jgi:hypothetical protein
MNLLSLHHRNQEIFTIMTRKQLTSAIIKLFKKHKINEFSSYVEEIVLFSTDNTICKATSIILNERTKGFEVTLTIDNGYSVQEVYTHKQLPLPILFRLYKWFCENNFKL